jgi:hypothetical protein
MLHYDREKGCECGRMERANKENMGKRDRQFHHARRQPTLVVIKRQVSKCGPNFTYTLSVQRDFVSITKVLARRNIELCVINEGHPYIYIVC